MTELNSPIDRDLDALLTGRTAVDDDLGALIQERDRQFVQKTGVNLKKDITPDDAARVIDLAERTRLPRDVVERNVAGVEKQYSPIDNDLNELIKNPALAKWLSDPFNAAAVKDDPSFTIVDKLLNSVARSWQNMQAGFAAGRITRNQRLLNSFDDLDKQLAAGVAPAAIPDALDVVGYRWMTPEDRTKLRAQTEGLRSQGSLDLENYIRVSRAIPAIDPTVAAAIDSKSASEFWEHFSKKPVEFIATVGAESFFQSMAGAFSLFAFRNPAVAAGVSGGVSYGMDYGASLIEGLRNEGVDVQNLVSIEKAVQNKELMSRVTRFAHAHAGPVALLDAVAVGRVGYQFAQPARSTAGAVWRTGQGMLEQGALGAAGEALGQTAAGKEFEFGQVAAEFFGEMVTAPIEMTGAMAGRYTQYLRAKEQQDFFRAIGSLAERNKLIKRLPDQAAVLVDELTKDGPVENVYIEPRLFTQYFQSQNIDPRTVARDLFGTDVPLSDALRLNKDLQIPVGAYTAKLAGTEHNAALSQDLKFDSTALSAREAKQLLDQERDRIKAMKIVDDQAPAIGDIVSEALRRQGYETGTAEALATQMEAFFRAQAARIPRAEDAPAPTAMDLFRRYALRILGRADEVRPGEVIEQPWYHGSGFIFDEFDFDMIGTGEGAQIRGWGGYFTRLKAVAHGYRAKLSRRVIQGVSDQEFANLVDQNWIAVYERARTQSERKALINEYIFRTEQAGRSAGAVYETHRKLGNVQGQTTVADQLQQITHRLALLGKMREQDLKIEKVGRTYEVLLDIEDSETLDLDKLVEDQPQLVNFLKIPAVRDAMAKSPHKVEWTGEKLYQALIRAVTDDRDTRIFDASLADEDASAAETVSKFFLANGIKGAAYVGRVDGPSIVVFDPGLIKIQSWEQLSIKAQRLKATGTAAHWVNRNEAAVNWSEIFNQPDPLATLKKLVDASVRQKKSREGIRRMAYTDLTKYLNRLMENRTHDQEEIPVMFDGRQIGLLRGTLGQPQIDTISHAVTEARAAAVGDWVKYLTRDNPIYKVDPFFQDFVLSGVAKWMPPDRINAAPQLEPAALAMVHTSITNDPSNASFESLYTKAMRELAANRAAAMTRVRTNEGKVWVKVPQTYPEHPDFEENTQMVRTLSSASWCTSSGMERDYLPLGDFWILTNGGVTELAIRFEDDKVAEIQGPANDGKIPPKNASDVKQLLDSGQIKLRKRQLLELQRSLLRQHAETMSDEDFIKELKLEVLPDGTIIVPRSVRDMTLFDNRPAIRERVIEIKRRGTHVYVGGDNGFSNLARSSGDVTLHRDAQAPNLTSVSGFLTLYRDAQAPNIAVASGDLTLYAGAQIPNVTSVGGNLILDNDAQAPNITSVGGDLTLREGTKAPNITSIGGGLTLAPGAHAPPNITSVSGNFTIYHGTQSPNITSAGSNFTAYVGANVPPNLTSVGGDLVLGHGVQAPSITFVGGDLILNAETQVPNVTSIGGDLTLGVDAHAPPNLTSVGGNATLYKNAQALGVTFVGGNLTMREDAQAPSVTSVGGNLTLDGRAQIPNVASVGGNAALRENAKAPNLISVGGNLTLREGAQAPSVTSVGGNLTVDGRAQIPNVASVGGDLVLGHGAQAPNVVSVGGNLTLDARVQVPNLTSIGGNLTLNVGAHAPPNITSVGGNLTLHRGAQAPNLTSVGGNLTLYADAQAPNLTSIGGNLILDEDAKAPPNLTSVSGNVLLYRGARAPNVVSVGGDLTLRRGAQAPLNLTSVGGNLTLYEGTQAPNITSVGGNVSLYGNAQVPNLTSVGGNLILHEGAQAPPNLRHVGGGAQEFRQEPLPVPDPGVILPQDQARGRLIKYGEFEYDIQLLETADLSTFLHESGHFYFEVMKSLAKDSPVIRSDLAILTKWMGADSVDQVTTEHHEKFARGIEAYFMEGKAPSVELRSVFARFRAWLMAIYTRIDVLGVRLNDDVRAVMDRMFATDAEIAAARHENELTAVFTTAEQVGMRPEEFERYLKTIESANRRATEAVQSELLQQWSREQEAWWNEQRSSVREEVLAEAHKRPDVIAYLALRYGRKVDGTEIEDPVKLDRDSLIEMYGAESEILPQLRRLNLYRREGGIAPNMLAPVYGFGSGDALVRALIQAQAYQAEVDATTDKIMHERHGDMLRDGTLPEKAIEAHMNDERSRILHAELKVLTKKRNEVAPFVQEEKNRAATETLFGLQMLRGVPSLDVFQRLARARVGAMTLRSISPNQFLVAARRASAEAVEAAATNDFITATAAKQRELFNMEMYRVARNAKEDTRTVVEHARSYGKTSVRQRLGRAGADYLDQIDAIVDRFDFRPLSARDETRRAKLSDWIANKDRQGEEIDLPDYIVDEAFAKPYKQLTYDELLGVQDALKHIDHMARLKNKLLKSKEKRDLQDIADTMVSTILENAKRINKAQTGLRDPSRDLIRLGHEFFASHRKMSSYLRQMDGFKEGGPMWQNIMLPLNEAASRESGMIHEAGKKLRDIFAPYMLGFHFIEAPLDLVSFGLIRRGVYKREHVSSINQSMSQMERLMVALNMGNEDNLIKLKTGRNWNDQQLADIVSTLTKQDWDFVQGVWDFVDSYWPLIKAKQERVTGVAPEKVEATPVQTKYGEYRGGYFPLEYEERLAPRVHGDRVKEAADMMMRGAYVRATTKRGHTKERVTNVKLPVRLDFGVIFEHVYQVVHDLTHHEALIDVNKLLGRHDIQTAIIQSHSDMVYDQLRRGVEAAAAGDVVAHTVFEKGVDWLRQGVSIAAMGWNISTALLQMLGISQAIVRVGPTWIWKGIARWMGDAVKMENTIKWIYEQSEFMQFRHNTLTREINEIRNSIRGHAIRSQFGDSYFWLIMQFQKIADIPTWVGMYEKMMAEGKSEADAIALADQAVLDAQGGGQIKDLADIQRGGPLMRLWTNFYNYFNTTYNLTVESLARTSLRDPASVGRFGVDVLLLYSVPAVLGFMLKEGLRGDEPPEDYAEKLAREKLAYMLGTMVGLREFSSVVMGYYGYSGPTGTRFFSEATKLMRQLQEGEPDLLDPENLVKSPIVPAAGILFHLPSIQAQKTAEGLVAWSEGEADPQAILFGPPREQR